MGLLVAACSGGGAHTAASKNINTTVPGSNTTAAGAAGTTVAPGKSAASSSSTTRTTIVGTGAHAVGIPANDVVVGNYEGQPLPAVQRAFTTNGLVLHVSYQSTTKASNNGLVGAQDPLPQALLPKGDTVNVIVDQYSAPPPAASTVSVPSLSGKTQSQAQTALQQDGLAARFVTVRTSSRTSDGKVVGQSPAPGTQVAPGSSVTLDIGQYSA